jgi:hypothetical protein
MVAQEAFCLEMAYQADVPLVLVDVQRSFCASTVSANALQHHFGMKGSRPYVVCKPLWGVFPSQSSPHYAQETQHLTSYLLGLQCKTCPFVVVFPLLLYVKTLLWPLLPCSRQGACWTVPGVPNLLAVP